jgi:hypothetical protein
VWHDATGLKFKNSSGHVITLGGGGGTPGGTNGQVQFNDSGVFGGDPNLIWDKANARLEVSGAISATLSLSAGINVENLIGDKTLVPGTDKMYQWLNPNGANRIITLDTINARAGDRFIIRNNDDWLSPYVLEVQQEGTILDVIYAKSIKEFIFDGIGWISGNVGTGLSSDFNISLGHNANSNTGGIAVGSNSNGSNNGVVVGNSSDGSINGIVVGHFSSGFNYGLGVGHYASAFDGGVAIGHGSNGVFSGVAVGSNAFGDTEGVAVGLFSNASSFGVAVGSNSNAFLNGVAVGNNAKGMRFGTSIGAFAGSNLDGTADRFNVLVGAFAGYQLTTGIGNIILGYQAGFDATFSPTTGSYNILIGYNAWTPADTTSNFLNIGGLIFGTDLTTTAGSVSNGKVGIGTATPEYTLDVSGNIRAALSLSAGINVESLTDDKTLVPGIDKMYQWLNPNGEPRVITLDTTNARAGDKFVIRNNDAFSSDSFLQITEEGDFVLDEIYAQSIREYIFDGTHWVSGNVGTGTATGASSDTNVALGHFAVGYFRGTAIGFESIGHSIGVAIGFSAYGPSNGVAVGYGAYGSSNGVAVGFDAIGHVDGVAVGYNARGEWNGVAVGYGAIGMRFGTAIGAFAGNNLDPADDRFNVLVGAYAGYQVTTGVGNIILGYQAGFDATFSPTTGSYNILIGYNAWTPTNATSNFLNIGGLIFGTDLSTTAGYVSQGKVGIGVSSPTAVLDLAANTSYASLRIRAGGTPATLNNGDIWFDGTNLYIRVGGVTKTFQLV